MKTLETLSKKIKFLDADPMIKTAGALRDVQPEAERLRQKAASKVCFPNSSASSCLCLLNL
jgi:vacuolar protein sorting-associated protein 52